MRGPGNADQLARKRAFLVLVQPLKARLMGSNCDADPHFSNDESFPDSAMTAPVQRWQDFTDKVATLEGDGRGFTESAGIRAGTEVEAA